MTTTLTVSQWAATHGISKQAGYLAVKRCGIPLVDGRVDPEVATALYRRRTRQRMHNQPQQGGAAPMPSAAAMEDPSMSDEQSYHVARARREAAEAELARLRLAEQRGELVRAADVRAALARRAAAFREGLMQIPSRLAAQLAAEGGESQGKVHRLIEAEIRAALELLTREDTPAEGQA